MVNGEMKVEGEKCEMENDKYSRRPGITIGSVEYNNTFDNNSESMCVAGQ